MSEDYKKQLMQVLANIGNIEMQISELNIQREMLLKDAIKLKDVVVVTNPEKKKEKENG